MYQITKEIHELVDQINQKYSLNIDINDGGTVAYKVGNEVKLYNRIEAKQIRTILNYLYVQLGFHENWIYQNKIIFVIEQKLKKETLLEPSVPSTVAEYLCRKWLDGLHPWFNNYPEKVLNELKKVLTELLCTQNN